MQKLIQCEELKKFDWLFHGSTTRLFNPEPGDKKEELGKHVEFTGHIGNISSYLERADIYVSSSYSEGMPVSLLEAMAWQLPVVASNIPGNTSVVQDQVTGFLYESNYFFIRFR